ncbi:uncharacterized protein KY384_000896 [Bacidia gigantensis]|uniref:uncharacterized protein n=1 Tax=Bacidia gigantensis TaxID=2732470 RepID=UPI001D03A8F2|nr:uncharacterized protein KY384_000896 [Bacidia gigantensis]KAG8534053.1 hypothetical protein KY384_000896 [Bacidia gigantensis]
MAPGLEAEVDDRLKDVIQDLYEIQSSIHGYLGPETKQVLIGKIHDLTASLQTLSATSAGLPTLIPPEIIDYVEEGRNPDIYTREFVEQVQKINMILKGKSEAYRTFRDMLAEEIVKGEVGTQEEVDQILESYVGEEEGEEVKQES